MNNSYSKELIKSYSQTFNTCIEMLEIIDIYIREISEENIKDYTDFYPFIDIQDILIYKDIDKDLILGYTKGIFLKINENIIANKETIFYKFIVSYILSLKIICDSTLYKPYSFILEMLREFHDLGKISKSLKKGKNDKNVIKKLKELEWDILIKCDFFVNKVKE